MIFNQPHRLVSGRRTFGISGRREKTLISQKNTGHRRSVASHGSSCLSSIVRPQEHIVSKRCRKRIHFSVNPPNHHMVPECTVRESFNVSQAGPFWEVSMVISVTVKSSSNVISPAESTGPPDAHATCSDRLGASASSWFIVMTKEATAVPIRHLIGVSNFKPSLADRQYHKCVGFAKTLEGNRRSHRWQQITGMASA